MSLSYATHTQGPVPSSVHTYTPPTISSSPLGHPTLLPQTLSAGLTLTLVIIITIALLFLYFLPRTISRAQHAGWKTGWCLSERSITAPSHPKDHPSYCSCLAPRRLPRLPPLLHSANHIPYIGLTIPQTLFLAVCIGIILFASFYQSNVISDANRSGYIALSLVPFAIAFGVKVGGVGTILQVGYASVSLICIHIVYSHSNYVLHKG